ncbi:MAG TPA: hypothetical protein ENJ60_04600 [Aeromonadales bacterium]|nr:hypothetical protein [Aeromonadales bacterium]
MNVLSLVPDTFQKISSGIFDFELIRLLSESESFAWWQDYCERFLDKTEDRFHSDDCYLASVNQQAS